VLLSQVVSLAWLVLDLVFWQPEAVAVDLSQLGKVRLKAQLAEEDLRS